MKQGFVYILSNHKNGTLYVGVTSDLIKRTYEHKNKLINGFSKKYNLTKLVYYEVHDNIEEATNRERQIKNWHRQWKINLLEKLNPNWDDLSASIEYKEGDPETSSGYAVLK